MTNNSKGNGSHEISSGTQNLIEDIYKTVN